jgi:hypothetical protein
MSDTSQTIQAQLNYFNASYAHAAMPLVKLGDFLAGQLKPITDTDARTVTANVLVMDVPGRIESVVATAGGATGICLIGPAGATTATHQCVVAYDTDGFATITFHGADAVTAAKVTYSLVPYPENPHNGVKGLGAILAYSPV